MDKFPTQHLDPMRNTRHQSSNGANRRRPDVAGGAVVMRPVEERRRAAPATVARKFGSGAATIRAAETEISD